MYIPLGFHFVVVRQAVHLVYEHLEFDGLIDLVGFRDCQMQLVQGLHVVVLGVYNKYQGSAAAEYHVAVKGWIEEVDLAGKVPDLKLHEARVADVVLDDFVGALEEERLVRRHFVEDHFLDRRFAASVIKMGGGGGRLKWVCLAIDHCWIENAYLLRPIRSILGFWSPVSGPVGPSPSPSYGV